MQVTFNNVEWTWFIRRVSVKKSLDNLSNIITSVSWSLKAEYIDPETQEHYVEDYSSITKLNPPDEVNFIEYAQINNDIVVSWISSIESEKLDGVKEEMILNLNQECGEEVTTVLNLES